MFSVRGSAFRGNLLYFGPSINPIETHFLTGWRCGIVITVNLARDGWGGARVASSWRSRRKFGAWARPQSPATA